MGSQRANKSALERALPIVAAAYGEQFGVNVVLSGTGAFTDGKTIVLPLLDNMSELKDVLFGYLAHESAHVRDSDFSTIKLCGSPVEKMFLNIIEDFRIEALIQEEFPGTQHTLDAMWKYCVEENMTHASRPEDNEANQLGMFLLHYVQTEGLGRLASKAFLEASRKVVEQTFPPGFFVRFNVLMAKKLYKLTCSNDCLILARAVLKALKEAENEERKQQEQKQKDQDQRSQSKDQDQTADDSSKSDSSQPGQDSPSGDGSEQDSDSDGSQSTEDSDSKDGSADDAQGNSDDADGTADGSDSDSNGSASSTDSDASQSNQNQTAPSPAPGSSDDQGGTKKPSMHDRMVKETDVVEDALQALKQEFNEAAAEDNKGANFSFKASNVGRTVGNEGDSSTLQEGILASAAIRARLQGLLAAQTRQKQWLHTSGKRIDGKRITRIASGDTRVFIKKDEMKRPDTAVHVLLDTSGSMTHRQEVANHATVSLALAVSSISQCDIAVSMFPGRGGAVSPMVSRGQPIRPNLGSFALDSFGCTPLAEAMLYAARELATSNRQRKVLIIITDGAPDDPGSVYYLTRTLEPHVDIYAIGIENNAVSRFFKEWTMISDVKELQSALFQIAGRFLDLH